MATTAASAPHPNDVQAELHRIAVSRTFAHAPHCCTLLDYLVRHRDTQHYSAMTIGVEVFGRSPTAFDPADDPVVGVQLVRLRTKLGEYYAGEGRANPLRIRVPVHGYRVRIERLEPAPPTRLRPVSATPAVIPFGEPMVVLTGVKAAFELTQHAISIKQQGIDFAIRYYSHSAAKNLSLAEARALTDAGIQIGVVWETIGAHLHSFSRAQGMADGACAYLMAQSGITQPSGSAIYFEVDCNPNSDDIAGPISRYFEGINQAFKAARPGEPVYQIGVYGSAACCAAIVGSGLATLSWLAPMPELAPEQAANTPKYESYNLKQLAPAALPVDDGRRIHVELARSNEGWPTGFFQVL
jgi:hypothetical protein